MRGLGELLRLELIDAQASHDLMPIAVRDRLSRLLQAQGPLASPPDDASSGNLFAPSGPTASEHGGWQDQVARGATVDPVLRLLTFGVAAAGVAVLATTALRRRERRA